MDNFVTVFVSAAVGAAFAVVGAILQTRLAARTKIDESLRADRTKHYETLWGMTGAFPRWPGPKPVTYAELGQFAEALRDWYFASKGGLFFSTEARDAYEDLQKKISAVLKEYGSPDAKALTPPHYEAVRLVCSQLRTEMTNDLQSRKRSLFDD